MLERTHLRPCPSIGGKVPISTLRRRAESAQIPPPVIPAFSRARRSEKVRGLPSVTRIFKRPRREELLDGHLPLENKPGKVSAAKSLWARPRSLLIPRWPWYGRGERAAGYGKNPL